MLRFSGGVEGLKQDKVELERFRVEIESESLTKKDICLDFGINV